MINASLKNYRISPRKVRVVADMIRGKKVTEAKRILGSVVKKAGSPLEALLDSAIANATHNYKIDKETLFVKEIRVDGGYTMKRSIPMSRGSAFPMKKRTSHVNIVLAPVSESGKANKAEKDSVKAKSVTKGNKGSKSTKS